MSFRSCLCFIGCLSALFTGSEALDIDFKQINSRCLPPLGRQMFSAISLNTDQSDLLQIVCPNLDVFKEPMSCYIAEILKHVPTEYQKYIPDKSDFVDALETVCEHRGEVDFKCLQSKKMTLQVCLRDEFTGAMGALSEQPSSGRVKTIICLGAKALPTCIKKSIQACGCQASKVFSDIIYDNLYPPTCPSISPARVRCSRTNPRAFVDYGLGSSGAGRTSGYSIETGSVVVVAVIMVIHFWS